MSYTCLNRLNAVCNGLQTFVGLCGIAESCFGLDLQGLYDKISPVYEQGLPLHVHKSVESIPTKRDSGSLMLLQLLKCFEYFSYMFWNVFGMCNMSIPLIWIYYHGLLCYDHPFSAYISPTATSNAEAAYPRGVGHSEDCTFFLGPKK